MAAPSETFLLRGFSGVTIGLADSGGRDNGKRAAESLSPSQAALCWSQMGWGGVGRAVGGVFLEGLAP